MRKLARKWKRMAAFLAAATCIFSGMPHVQAADTEAWAGTLETETADSERMLTAYSQSLPAAQDETSADEDAAIDGEYTDSSGVTFSYHGYEDGTAAIYAIADYSQKDVSIPSEVGGYTVTWLDAGFPTNAEISSLTIPEAVTYIGEDFCREMTIGTLYYNAAEASTTDNSWRSPFVMSEIGAFQMGENVRIIPAWMFNQAVFEGSVSVTVPEVASHAFDGAVFQKLVLTDSVRVIQASAFEKAEIQTLHYGIHASYTEKMEAAFYHSYIHELIIGDDVTELPGYVFSGAYFQFDEFICDLKRIGDHAFDSAWNTKNDYAVKLTITENVEYIGINAFKLCKINRLQYNAIDARIGDDAGITKDDGPFKLAELPEVSIGERVEVIPRCLFANAELSMESLVLPASVEEIGDRAFYADQADHITIGSLVIGDRARSIGESAFYRCGIQSLVIGKRVSYIGGAAFKNCDIKELKIGESVSYIGAEAFRGNDAIESADVYAVKADEAYKALSFKKAELPVCKAVRIHEDSDFHSYFSERVPMGAAAVEPLCEYGDDEIEEYLDEAKLLFITQYTKSCAVCGHAFQREETEPAYVVKFVDYDESVLSQRYIREGVPVEVPEDPAREGYRFAGWDGDTSQRITEDMTFRAVYEEIELPPSSTQPDSEEPAPSEPSEQPPSDTEGDSQIPDNSEDGSQQPGDTEGNVPIPSESEEQNPGSSEEDEPIPDESESEDDKLLDESEASESPDESEASESPDESEASESPDDSEDDEMPDDSEDDGAPDDSEDDGQPPENSEDQDNPWQEPVDPGDEPDDPSEEPDGTLPDDENQPPESSEQEPGQGKHPVLKLPECGDSSVGMLSFGIFFGTVVLLLLWEVIYAYKKT